ncbi:signal peptide peptidase SppA [Candidatus Woesearchaeota archaeon]|nr:signal peptide peptidase SppA [Candidatus Woesearchaeota archaeon]
MKRGVTVLGVIGIVILSLFVILFLIGIFFASLIGMSSKDGLDGLGTGNVAVIPISGPISATGSSKLSGKPAIADDIVKFIEKAEESSSIKAIMLDINSPGGTAVGSSEIAEAIKNAKKPTVAVIRETGASGAFWIATAADHVIANRASITGSIGVIASSLEFGEFIEEHNVTYRRLVAGRLKDIGTPFREMTPEEEALFQQSLDKLHAIFKESVADNRNLSKETIDAIATGMFYTGEEALNLGLVDQLGGKPEAKAYLEQLLGTKVEFVTYEKPKTFAEALFSSIHESSLDVGRGIGQELVKEGGVEVRT